MKNPKTFSGPTPYTHSKPVDHSGPSKPLVHNSTRPWTGPTSPKHHGHVPKSGGSGIGNPRGIAKAEQKSGMGMPEAIGHSGRNAQSSPKANVHKSWKKKNYAMGMTMGSDD